MTPTTVINNIIFLGGLFPDEAKEEIYDKSIGPVQYAADALQWAIVKGLDHFLQVKIINLPYIGSYPSRFKDLNVKSFKFSHTTSGEDENVGFINLAGYKMISRYIRAKRALKYHLVGVEAVVIYSVHTPFIKAAVELKNKFPDLKICLIVPDLPEFMGGNDNILWKLAKQSEHKILESLLKKVDAFVVLSDYMHQPLNIGNRPWIRIEGIYNGENNCPDFVKKSPKTILYTGSLAKRYGILDLLTAFKLIPDPDYRLWICGDGDALEEINHVAENDKRIHYFGQLKREDVLVLQKQATVLVNPRNSKGEYTKYSFPSKIMEYYASGTPCIMNRLPGIPDEYYDYCFIPETESTDSLANIMVRVCEMDEEELITLGSKARKFISENKNSKVQSQKIADLLNSLA